VAWELVASAVLIAGLGLFHSVMGERYIVRRVMRREQPKLFGSDEFTKRTMRFAWHVTTLFAWAIAAVLILDPNREILLTVAGTMVLAAILTIVVSHGRHLSWLVELAVAALIAWNVLG
jgi:hypothetical protein